MTQEEKELLLKDISARLPYGVKVRTNRGPEKIEGLAPFCHNEVKIALNLDWSLSISDFTPYLRPMSSMTEDERKEYTSLCNRQDIDTPTWSKIIWHDTYKSIDWLNKKMFDYRKDDKGKTMIEKGLALEAPEGMYNSHE